MGSVVAKAEVLASYNDVISALRLYKHASNVYFQEIKGDPRVAIMCGEKFFLRTGAWGGVTIVVVDAGNKTLVDVIGYAAASGILKISFMAERAYAKEILSYLSEKFQVNVLSDLKL